MADRAMDVYLNDHLGGATLGTELAQQIRDRHEGTPLGQVMISVAVEVEADRRTLLGLMERMGTSPNPVKQATGWVAEKVMWLKFAGIMSGEPDHGAFMALESLALGVEGKVAMWKALKDVEDCYPSLATTNLDELIGRAEEQKAIVERERLAVGRHVFGADRGMTLETDSDTAAQDTPQEAHDEEHASDDAGPDEGAALAAAGASNAPSSIRTADRINWRR